jgi:hypothetical protein
VLLLIALRLYVPSSASFIAQQRLLYVLRLYVQLLIGWG